MDESTILAEVKRHFADYLNVFTDLASAEEGDSGRLQRFCHFPVTAVSPGGPAVIPNAEVFTAAIDAEMVGLRAAEYDTALGLDYKFQVLTEHAVLAEATWSRINRSGKEFDRRLATYLVVKFGDTWGFTAVTIKLLPLN